MFSAIAILFLVPWLDKAKVKSIRYRGPISKVMLGMLVVCFLWLMVIGSGPGTAIWETWVGRVLTFLYFAFFITMPIWTKLDSTKPVPERVTTHD
ncbi:Cytochrome b/c1 [compost metagenome]